MGGWVGGWVLVTGGWAAGCLAVWLLLRGTSGLVPEAPLTLPAFLHTRSTWSGLIRRSARPTLLPPTRGLYGVDEAATVRCTAASSSADIGRCEEAGEPVVGEAEAPGPVALVLAAG